ncbi:flagellar basal body rod protein FlgB [Phreatobacter sp.]|uniref:flagellar basal body rod protein FlgB n=1 Tax=Phreatobacter sp. TaxID=1966341 RepID=UPI0022BF1551|nr:flagellar basal body rod protein FlgB [Phreatobacter sp.]MCZ8314508.1 flagellar basal body rod protein FlgB [Phreatobacter sp.]
MATSDVPIFSMLRNRMRWHQDRQKLLAENVANSETPGYRARDLAPPNFDSMLRGGPRAAASAGASTGVGPVRTDPGHIGATGSTVQNRFDVRRNTGLVATPDGNRVNLEDEMLKVAQNQMDYQAVAGLYQRSLGLVRIAIGKKA